MGSGTPEIFQALRTFTIEAISQGQGCGNHFISFQVKTNEPGSAIHGNRALEQARDTPAEAALFNYTLRQPTADADITFSHGDLAPTYFSD